MVIFCVNKVYTVQCLATMQELACGVACAALTVVRSFKYVCFRAVFLFLSNAFSLSLPLSIYPSISYTLRRPSLPLFLSPPPPKKKPSLPTHWVNVSAKSPYYGVPSGLANNLTGHGRSSSGFATGRELKTKIKRTCTWIANEGETVSRKFNGIRELPINEKTTV